MDSKNENLDMCLGEGLNINWDSGIYRQLYSNH